MNTNTRTIFLNLIAHGTDISGKKTLCAHTVHLGSRRHVDPDVEAALVHLIEHPKPLEQPVQHVQINLRKLTVENSSCDGAQ